MKTFEFTIVGAATTFLNGELAERLFDAGCDDATASFQKGVTILEFDRSAKSFYHALRSALDDVARAGVEPLRIEPDHLVSLSDIAARSGLTRAAASLYAKGARGKAFPVPRVRVTTESPLWDWVEVARWLFRQGKLSLPDLVQARLLRKENRAIRRSRVERTEKDPFSGRAAA